jgi:four helix bundle protein
MSIYQRIIAWQKAMDLVVEIYDVTKSFPDHERFGLKSQLCRGAVSVPSNIAEGRGCSSRLDYRRFVQQARGSLYETQTQILIAQRLRYISDERADTLMENSTRVIQLVSGLIRSLTPTPDPRPPTP